MIIIQGFVFEMRSGMNEFDHRISISEFFFLYFIDVYHKIHIQSEVK